MNRVLPLLPVVLAFAVSGCASLSFKDERRLADADQTYRVHKLLVLPMLLTFRACPEDVDQRARKTALIGHIRGTTSAQLQTRGYALASAASEPAFDPKAPHNRDLAQALCGGSVLKSLPPSVGAYAAEAAKRAGAQQVFLGGFSRLRWHLKMDMGTDNGASGNDVSQFEVRAVGALYDVAQKRVVWSEFVDGQLYTDNYDHAVDRVLLFSELKHTDPHEKLFYDLPLPETAPK